MCNDPRTDLILLEPTPKNDNMYIDPIVDATYRWCLSADRRFKGEFSEESAWGVHFDDGFVVWYVTPVRYCVRAVRSYNV